MTTRRPSKKPRQSGAGLAGLAARLTKRLADENPRANLVFSPLSIYAAVALLVPGARGDTLDEILRLLGARSRDELEESISTMVADALKDRSDSGGPSVAFACGVWNDRTRPLKPAYREAVVGTTYRAEARNLDFHGNAEAAAGQINAWVAGFTRDLIKDLVSASSFSPTTDVVLANAIYFKGKWDLPFYERDTMDRPFHMLGGAAVDAPFMRNPSRHFIAVHDGFKVLKLQYKMQQQDYRHPLYPWAANLKNDTQYSMCIFLPDAYDGLRTLLDEITSRPSFVQEHLPWSKVMVGDFGVPKFKLDFTSNVTEILKGLGLWLPFDEAAGDLRDMVEPTPDASPFVVQDVIHKAVIEVNEEGTVAAAVTMMLAGPIGCPMMPTVDFVADHPFAYFIVEEASGTILFAGHVVDPTDGDAPARTGTGQPAVAAARGGYELPPMIRNPPMHLDHLAGPTRNAGSTGLATLAARLAKGLAEGSSRGNLIFSPLSIYTALALLAAGARAATLDEILRVLGTRSRGELEEFVSRTAADALEDRSDSGGPSVSFACGVWSDLTRPLKPAFREAVVGTYKAEASVVDFRHAPEEARAQINAWAAQATRNLIQSVLGPGSIKPATTRVVLGNAVYFKGGREDQPFDEKNTMHRPFHRLDRTTVDVPFMQSSEAQFVAVHSGFKVLKLRYRMAARDGATSTMTPAAATVEESDPDDPYTYSPAPPQSGEYGGHVPPYIDFLHGSAAQTAAAYRPFQPRQMLDTPYFRGHLPARGFFIPPQPLPPPFTPYYHASPYSSYPRPPYPPQSVYGHGAFHHAAPYGYGYPSPNAYVPRPHAAAPASHAFVPHSHSYAPAPRARSRYAGPPQFSICIFLPDAHDGLWWLLDRIASWPGFLHDHLPERRVAVGELRVPRFKLSFQSSMVAVLRKLGLELPFCGRGDLFDMVEDDGSGLPIMVDDIIHKAVIEVNEEGTQAAAVTMESAFGGSASGYCPRPPPVDFVADHPFAFYIVEEATGAVVFAGHVLDPSSKG